MSNEFTSIFKVFFEGGLDQATKGLSLSFFGSPNKQIKMPSFPNFLMKFNELARKKQTYSVGNIKEVLPLGKADKTGIGQFHVLLFEMKNANANNIKNGFLIAHHKELGYIILGNWPYNTLKTIPQSPEEYDAIFEHMVQDNNEFTNMLLIS